MNFNILITSNGVVGTNFKDNFIKGKSVIVVDNGTYGTANYNDRDKNVDKFYEYGAVKVDLLTVDNNNISSILNYDICYVMGGSIANLVTFVQKVTFKDTLIQFLKKGIYIGESAGSIILDADVEWYFNLKRGTKPKYDVIFESYEGLGFINRHIYPHYDKEKLEGVNKIINYNGEIETLNDGEYIELYL
jgi:Peptidase E